MTHKFIAAKRQTTYKIQEFCIPNEQYVEIDCDRNISWRNRPWVETNRCKAVAVPLFTINGIVKDKRTTCASVCFRALLALMFEHYGFEKVSMSVVMRVTRRHSRACAFSCLEINHIKAGSPWRS